MRVSLLVARRVLDKVQGATIHPDGKTLAFVRDGMSIKTAPVSGSTKTV